MCICCMGQVDALRRELRMLDYKMQRVKVKAEQAKDTRESIELHEDKVRVRHAWDWWSMMVIHGVPRMMAHTVASENI